MKRVLSLALPVLLLLSAVARADGPDDDYVVIYNLIQKADSLNDKGQFSQAMAKYLQAQKALKKFQDANPGWNVKVVKYRLNYLASKIAAVSTNLPPAGSGTNAPAGSGTNSTTTTSESTPAPSNTSGTTMMEAPVVPAASTTSAVLSPEAENQINALKEQIRQIEADKVLLQAKLKEALAAQPPTVDPRELTQAQDRIVQLQRENELLKVSLAQAKTNAIAADSTALEKAQQALADANRKIAQLTEATAVLATEKQALQARVKASAPTDETTEALRAENEVLKKQVAEFKNKSVAASKGGDINRQLLEAQAQIVALQSDKEILRLEKMALENRVKRMASEPAPAQAPAVAVTTPAPATAGDPTSEAKIRQLESQRDELQKSLDAATRDLQGRKKGKETAARILEMSQQLASLRARIDVLEAKPVPYTAEELALLQAAPNGLVATAHTSTRKSARRLSPEGARLAAEAQRFVAAGQLDKAEEKYLEVVKTDGNDPLQLRKLAALEVDLDHLDSADKHVHQALALEPDDPTCLAVLGQLRFHQANYDAALEALSRAAQLDPQDATIQNLLGMTLAEKGLRGPAETALRKAIQIDPGYGTAHHNLAWVYILQKPPLVELARWHYQKALAAGVSRNPRLEKLLDGAQTASVSP